MKYKHLAHSGRTLTLRLQRYQLPIINCSHARKSPNLALHSLTRAAVDGFPQLNLLRPVGVTGGVVIVKAVAFSVAHISIKAERGAADGINEQAVDGPIIGITSRRSGADFTGHGTY